MVQAIVCADGFNNVLRLPVASFATMNFVLWHGHYSPADTDSDRRASPVYLCAYLSLAFLTDRSHYVLRFAKKGVRVDSSSVECLCAASDFQTGVSFIPVLLQVSSSLSGAKVFLGEPWRTGYAPS